MSGLCRVNGTLLFIKLYFFVVSTIVKTPISVGHINDFVKVEFCVSNTWGFPLNFHKDF